MLPGFNHNLRHRNEVFHVQTEDGGLDNPKVVTQLFLGGRLLGINRWSYQGLLGAEMSRSEVEDVVKTRMMAQHKAMLRAVTLGDFDEKAGLVGSVAEAPTLEVPIEGLPLPYEPLTEPELPPRRKLAPSESEERLVPRAVKRRSLKTPGSDPSVSRARFEAPRLTDEELLAEIDAELQRHPVGAPNRGPVDARGRRFHPYEQRTPGRPTAPPAGPVAPRSSAGRLVDRGTGGRTSGGHRRQDRANGPGGSDELEPGPGSRPYERVSRLRPESTPHEGAPSRRSHDASPPRHRQLLAQPPVASPAAAGGAESQTPTRPQSVVSRPPGRRIPESETSSKTRSPVDLPAKPSPAEPLDAPSLADVILDYLSRE